MDADARPAPDLVRTVVVRRIAVRVSVRPGTGALADEPPLLLCNGIGASFEALQPLVDALDPRRGRRPLRRARGGRLTARRPCPTRWPVWPRG